MRYVLPALLLVLSATALSRPPGVAAHAAATHRAASFQRQGSSRAKRFHSDLRDALSPQAPTSQQPAEEKLTPSLGCGGSNLGKSVALSGDGKTAIVGAPSYKNSQGVSCIYGWNGAHWVLQATLLASDGAAGDNFGWFVALSSGGGTAVVGAPYKNHSTGAAYVFTGTGTTWTQAKELTASDAAAGDMFGLSVAVATHNTTEVVVGAPGKNNITGEVYHYTRGIGTNPTWTETTIIPSGGEANDEFGTSETVVALQAGTTYTLKLVWKANKSDPGTVWAGAGPIGGQFSPTRLTVLFPPPA